MDASAYHKIGVELADSRSGGDRALRLVIISESMSPLLQPGDAVIVRPAECYAAGDILSVRQDDHVLTHRLVDVRAGFLILKGDQNRRFDPPVLLEHVLGRLSAFERTGNLVSWQSGKWDRTAALLSRLEGRLYERLAPKKGMPSSFFRRVVLRLSASPAHWLYRRITGRIAIKYTNGTLQP